MFVAISFSQLCIFVIESEAQNKFEQQIYIDDGGGKDQYGRSDVVTLNN